LNLLLLPLYQTKGVAMKAIIKHILLLSLLLIFAFSESCRAEEIHKEWYQCQQDDQCIIVEADCGVEWAANKDFIEKTRKEHGSYYCTKPIEEHPTNTVKKCENHRCILSPRGMYAGGTPIP